MSYFKGVSLDTNIISKELYDIAKSGKLIGKCAIEQWQLKKVLDVIDRVNNLDEFAESINGIRLEDIKIPSCFKDFVMPSKVSYKLRDSYPNLREYNRKLDNEDRTVGSESEVSINDNDTKAEDKMNEFSFSIRELNNIYLSLSSNFKGADLKLVAITDIRQQGTIEDFHCAAVVNGRVMVESPESYNFIPVVICPEYGKLLGEHVLNETADYVVEKYLDRFKFC